MQHRYDIKFALPKILLFVYNVLSGVAPSYREVIFVPKSTFWMDWSNEVKFGHHYIQGTRFKIKKKSISQWSTLGSVALGLSP